MAKTRIHTHTHILNDEWINEFKTLYMYKPSINMYMINEIDDKKMNIKIIKDEK